MLLLLLLPLIMSSRIQKTLKPGKIEVYYEILGKNDMELNIQLAQHTSADLKYRIVGPKDVDDSELLNDLVEPVNVKYTVAGTYMIEVRNADSKNGSINVYTHVTRSSEVDNDNLAIKNLFIDLESKLTSLFNANMRLKAIQERNIIEARRIRNGLYIMFVIPILYVVIGFGKLHGIKIMFAPKQGSRI